MILSIVARAVAWSLLLPLAPLVLLRRWLAAPRGGWVHLGLDGEVVEVAPPRPLLSLGPPSRGLSLERLRELVDAMSVDPRPRGLLLTVRSLSASAAHRTAVVRELSRLRAAGKEVVLHLPSGGATGELSLARGASRVLVGRETSLGPLGVRAVGVYLRRALDQAGLMPDVHAVGAFKSAGEPLTREGPSDAQRAQTSRMLDVLHDDLVAGLAAARRLERAEVERALDAGLLGADDLVARGLADAVCHDDEALSMLEGERASAPARAVGAGRYLARRRRRATVRVLPRPVVAVVAVDGAITERGPAGASAERLVGQLELALSHPRVGALVLAVDSPGGGVLASEKIHRAVARVAEKKPVIAAFGGVAASGGYYVSAPAHVIVAERTSITGSIGVVAARVVAGPLLARLGVDVHVEKRGAHADLLLPHRPFDDDEQALFSAELSRAYDRFVSLVAEGRRLTTDAVRELAGGRVWMGVDARERGLVDREGGLATAIEEARARMGPRGARAVVRSLAPRPPVSLPSLRALLRGDEARLFDLARTVLGSRERVLALWSGGPYFG